MSRHALMGRLALALLAGTVFSDPSAAQDPSGTTVVVNPSTAASGASGVRVLEVQGPVFMGDEIRTDLHGQAQILFVDDTKFVVGSNSKVLIDSFVFDPSKTAQDVGINAVKGTFRFITGASPKNAYAIRTPTMTIGVRGTAFDLAVRGGGESTIAVHEGATRLCDAFRQCIDANEGSIIVAEPGGGFREVVGLERRRRIQVFFPFVATQVGLAPGFQVEDSAIAGIGSDTDNTGFPDPVTDPRPRAAGSSPPASDPPGDGRPPR